MKNLILALIIILLPFSAMAQESAYSKMYPCAEAEYTVCQLELGKAYAFGEGINIGLNQALYWLKQKPIQKGNIQAIDLVYAIEEFRKNGDVSLLEEIKAENLATYSNVVVPENDQ